MGRLGGVVGAEVREESVDSKVRVELTVRV